MTKPISPAPGAEEHVSLAEDIRRGDASAEERLVGLFHERIRLMAQARTRDPEAAKELAQDVLMAVVTSLRRGQLRDGEKLTAFVYGTARNLVNNYIRARARRPEEQELPSDAMLVSPADATDDEERMMRVRMALTTLPATDRQVLLLTLVDGLKPREIARRLGLSDEVVRARKSRALKKIIEFVRDRSRT